MASGGAMEYLNITDEVPGLIPVESSVEAFSGDTVTLSTFISTTNGLLTYVHWKDPSGDTVLEYPAPGEEVNALPSNLVISDASLEESGTYNVTVQSREGLISEDTPSSFSVSLDGTVTVTSTLTITESRYDDRGRYSCSAYNTLTTISHTDTTESTLNINPMIRIESEDLTSNVVLASFGTSLTIQCFGSGNLVWTTPPNQTVFTSYDPSRNVLTLSIPNFVTPARYTCSSDLVAGLEKTILITTDVLPSARVSPSRRTVEVGDSVDVVCATDGTGPLDTQWIAENGDVVADGSQLTIATATLVHSGVYTCAVSSPFSAAQATFDLTVLGEATCGTDRYDDVISPTHKVSFYHGDGDPLSFRCLVNGSVGDTSFTWQLSGGGSVPSVTMVDSTGSGSVLTWTHRLEYTDTGTYVCLVREPATGRLALLLSPQQSFGPALTCTAFASPSPPDVKWSKNSGSLPRGIDTNTTVVGGIAISQLVFSSQFSVANVGTYKCEVRRTGEEGLVDSQLVELSQGDPATTAPVGDCESVSEDMVLFQLRVATSGCMTWNQDRKSAITEEFQNFLFRLMSTQCHQEDCVTKETLTVVSLECSDVKEGGAVFRGTIETGSASKTEMVTCALSRWQRSRPLVTVEDKQILCRLSVWASNRVVRGGRVFGARERGTKGHEDDTDDSRGWH
ncbi:Basement membrane-specific heparan sulfate proteoglycan core protein [Geodia barretti]|uniref:Basement membrane-specific heparan sulfate proteoglycan core protein n=1 Tax=Geodia barretti TaxID=519541 RepID=A0AA35T0L9_GEOBA|nr:Basement membrane-specific heparan sulfate proteoglycan core protein [Geodia barretti]